jgi:transposase
MRRSAYGGTRVNPVDVAKLLDGKEAVGVTVGIDVGKHKLLAVCRWADGIFERPWRIHNPSELSDLVKLLQQVACDRQLVVAMESSGTYGDALRQALGREVAGCRQDRAPLGRRADEPRCPSGGMAEASDPGLAQQALQARQQGQRGEGRLRVLARGHGVLEAPGQVIGIPTACVLWVSTGDPRQYYAAAAYRKAMGLNLVERSSGEFQGALRISKRGSARSRQWLYFAVLRLVQKAGVRSWYEAKKARDPDAAKSVLVALMRKLVLALYQVAVHNHEFDARRLFARIPTGVQTAKESSGKRVVQA